MISKRASGYQKNLPEKVTICFLCFGMIKCEQTFSTECVFARRQRADYQHSGGSLVMRQMEKPRTAEIRCTTPVLTDSTASTAACSLAVRKRGSCMRAKT